MVVGMLDADAIAAGNQPSLAFAFAVKRAKPDGLRIVVVVDVETILAENHIDGTRRL